MSLVMIFDPKKNQIVKELTATASYRSPLGVTIKPKTYAEEQRLRKISETSVKIEEMKAQIAKMDRDIEEKSGILSALQMTALTQQRRRMAEEVQRKENFSHAVMTIHRLQQRAAELENIILSIPTVNGPVEMEIRTDDYTDGGLSRLSAQIDDLSATFMSDEPEHVKHTMQTLLKLEEALEALPHEANSANIRFQLRLQLAQGVADRAAEGGWSVTLEEHGSVTTPTHLTLTSFDRRASVFFFTNDEISLETPGFPEGERAALQELVLHALRDSGAVDTTARCCDHDQNEPPVFVQDAHDYETGKEKDVLRL